MVLKPVNCIREPHFTLCEELNSVSKCASLEEDPEGQRTEISQHPSSTTVRPRAQHPAMPHLADIWTLVCGCNGRLQEADVGGLQ